MKKTTYHIHTERCHHARGSDEEFVRCAILGGYEEIGFSDHSPWPYESGFLPRIRMQLRDFDEYYQSILSLKRKYADQISIKIGLECEYFPQYMDWLRSFIQEKKLDYVIFGNHFDGSDETGVYYGRGCGKDEVLLKYTKDIEEGIQTGIYSYLAHPDLYMRGRVVFDELAEQCAYRICRACKEAGMMMEYNLEGMRVNELHHAMEYPHDAFWKIAAEVGNEVIIGVDAHHSESMETNRFYEQATADLKRYGLSVNHHLDYKW